MDNQPTNLNLHKCIRCGTGFTPPADYDPDDTCPALSPCCNVPGIPADAKVIATVYDDAPSNVRPSPRAPGDVPCPNRERVAAADAMVREGVLREFAAAGAEVDEIADVGDAASFEAMKSSASAARSTLAALAQAYGTRPPMFLGAEAIIAGVNELAKADDLEGCSTCGADLHAGERCIIGVCDWFLPLAPGAEVDERTGKDLALDRYREHVMQLEVDFDEWDANAREAAFDEARSLLHKAAAGHPASVTTGDVERAAISFAQRVADRPERCDGCQAYAVTSDSEGTPLCGPCVVSLAEECITKVNE